MRRGITFEVTPADRVRLDGLFARQSRPPGLAPLGDELVKRVVALTLEPPREEATHWTVRAMQRHRHQEFIHFLNAVEAQLPKDKAVHVILDNYATHKPSKVREWLVNHPRGTFHFVQTSSSWLNAVEGFFAKLTRRLLKNGVFHSVGDLQAAISRFIKERNQDPRPFTWKAKPEEIIAAVKRGYQTLKSIQ